GAHLERLRFAEEGKLLDEVAKRFAEYRKVDKDVLSLAVENTNLKAQRLSFGPVREAADELDSSLGYIIKAAPHNQLALSRVEATTRRALIDVREIQVLQDQHIAEADDAAMGRLEKEMTARQRDAREALAALPASTSKTLLDAAASALDKFD